MFNMQKVLSLTLILAICFVTSSLASGGRTHTEISRDLEKLPPSTIEYLDGLVQDLATNVGDSSLLAQEIKDSLAAYDIVIYPEQNKKQKSHSQFKRAISNPPSSTMDFPANAIPMNFSKTNLGDRALEDAIPLTRASKVIKDNDITNAPEGYEIPPTWFDLPEQHRPALRIVVPEGHSGLHREIPDEPMEPSETTEELTTFWGAESFEGSSFPPSGWGRWGANSGDYTWHREGATASSGSYCAAVFWNATGQDEFLYTPLINISNYFGISLRWYLWMVASSGDYYNKFRVYYSLDNVSF